MKKGFTVIELLIVITITVILLGMGALSLGKFRQASVIDNEAQKLVAVLQNAQQKAVGQDGDSRWGVYFDTAQTRDAYYLFKVNEAIMEDPGIPGDVVDTRTLAGSLYLEIGANPTLSVIFAKSSGRPETAASITISDGNAATAKTVTITAQGRIDYE